MKKQMVLLCACFIFLNLSCTSMGDSKNLSNFEKTKRSVAYLREGKAEYGRIVEQGKYGIDDFERVITLWEKGLKIHPRNTQIRKEIVTLLFNMARTYSNKKARFAGQPMKIKEIEKKAISCYKRALMNANVLIAQRSPQTPKEEWDLLNVLISSNAYLGDFREALRILNGQINSLPDNDPKIEILYKGKDALEKAIKAFRKKKNRG